MGEHDEKVMKLVQKVGVGARLPNDPFFQDGNNLLGVIKKFGLWEEDDEDFFHEPVSVFSCHVWNCHQSFTSMYQYDLHYNAAHRYSCVECRKTLQTAHLLDLHVGENHDSYFAAQAERKPMFQCYLEECKSVFDNSRTRKDHCMTIHKFPSSFPFEISKSCQKDATAAKSLGKDTKKKVKKPPTKNIGEAMDVTTAVPTKLPKKDKKPEDVNKKPATCKTNHIPKVNENNDLMNLPKNKILGYAAASGGGRLRIFTSFAKDLADSLPMDVEPNEGGPSRENIE